MNLRSRSYSVIYLLIPVFIAGIIKTWLMTSGSIPFNADEAIVALMARHINQGEIPIFFYGQAYMGSLDAILVAQGFKLFGQYIWVIRFIQTILYAGTVFTTALLGYRLFGTSKAALFSGFLIAIPPVNVSLYTTVSLGGYGEMLLIGNILLLGGLYLLRRIKSIKSSTSRDIYIHILFLGILAGFGFWVIGLSLVYSISIFFTIGFVLWKRGDKRIFFEVIGLLIIGAILGALPWWLYTLGEGGMTTISELAGSAISGLRDDVGLMEPLARFGNFLLFGVTVIFGLRPPWGVHWLMLPLIPFILLFWFATIFICADMKSNEYDQSELWMIRIIGIVLLAGFIFSPFGADPSGRYFVPLIIPMALFGTLLLINRIQSRNYAQLGILILILAFNLGGTIQSALKVPPGLTTQFDSVTQIDHQKIEDLILFLKDEEIFRGYSNYWVSYPLAFLSEEEIVFVPRLPYHEDFRYTSRDDRYVPYQKFVSEAEEVGYITTNHPELNDYLRGEFTARGITWVEKEIGDYLVFYDLSALIHAHEIGLGETTTP